VILDAMHSSARVYSNPWLQIPMGQPHKEATSTLELPMTAPDLSNARCFLPSKDFR
jgi:hypothetical protein